MVNVSPCQFDIWTAHQPYIIGSKLTALISDKNDIPDVIDKTLNWFSKTNYLAYIPLTAAKPHFFQTKKCCDIICCSLWCYSWPHSQCIVMILMTPSEVHCDIITHDPSAVHCNAIHDIICYTGICMVKQSTVTSSCLWLGSYSLPTKCAYFEVTRDLICCIL